MKKINSNLFKKMKDAEVSSKTLSLVQGGAWVYTSSGRPNSADCRDDQTKSYQEDTVPTTVEMDTP